jgi:hypothetical protein
MKSSPGFKWVNSCRYTSELNAHKQTRQETLSKAADIFGDSNSDLYATFEMLLVKHLPK